MHFHDESVFYRINRHNPTDLGETDTGILMLINDEIIRIDND